MNIYPSYTLIFIIFNLLGWWYKGRPFISWWWFILIIGVEIFMQALALAIAKAALRFKE